MKTDFELLEVLMKASKFVDLLLIGCCRVITHPKKDSIGKEYEKMGSKIRHFRKRKSELGNLEVWRLS